MRILAIILLAALFLSAKSSDTCYTVQLISKHNSKNNFNLLSANDYPEACRIMEIGTSLTVRCKCYDDFAEASALLNDLQAEYKNAVVSSTYKYRFDNIPNNKQTTTLEKDVAEKTIIEIKQPKKEEEPSKPVESKETCYTVQLTSSNNSTNNLEALERAEYPQSCKIMKIGNALTVRCGCYEKYVEAKKSLNELQKNYDDAAITNTYRYRFGNEENIKLPAPIAPRTQKVKEKTSVNQKKDSLKVHDEELRLIMQVFLYRSDLDNAYRVATAGYKKYPNSYYWNEKMAEICKWTNRTARSMKHLRNMYNMSYDKKIEDELIQYGSESYQYEEIEPLVVSRAVHNPTEENVDHMILIYKKIGSPEKVIGVLAEQYKIHPQNRMLLTKGLELSLELADLELAKFFVDKIKEKKPYKKIDAALIAKYHYVQQEMEVAYENLSYVDLNDTANEEYNVRYYELQSDLGWYLQDNQSAAKASKNLMDLDKARLADYERIAFVYKNSDPELAFYAMKRAYVEYKMSYLFYSYADASINSKNFDELNDFLSTIDETESPLLKDSLYWIVKSNVYGHYGEIELEKEALIKALELNPENYQIKLTLLYYFMRVHDTKELRDILTDMADYSDLDYSFYFPMASAYFYLSDINRASYYTQELLHAKNPVTEILEFKFLQAYIYQIQNNESAYVKSMKDILANLKMEERIRPELKKQNQHLSYYLRAAMGVINPDKFEKELKKAKPYLDEKDYNEISYSWAVQNGAYEKSLQIYHKMDEKDIWIRFSKNIIFQEHDKIENLLNIYLSSLSMGDASQATELDGQVSLSQSFTYDGLSKNGYNQNAYIHHRDLSKIRNDYLDVKTSYYKREPLLQKYVKVDNRVYVHNGFYFDSNIEYYKNTTLDEKKLLTVPNHTLEAGIGFKKIFDRGSVSAHFDYYDSMERYYGASISSRYRFSTDLVAKAKFALNDNALESTQLLLGGKKDSLALNLTWNFLNSTSLDVSYEKNLYTSQDEVDLGDGDIGRIGLTHQIRNGYPDIRVGSFVEFGLYDETTGSKGVIDELQASDYEVLPRDYYNLGVNLSYGMANADDYTRAWRPYVEFYPYYNSDQDDYTFGLNVGYGGKVWHQDHLIFGASYSESVDGIGGKIFEVFLDYHFMYAHP